MALLRLLCSILPRLVYVEVDFFGWVMIQRGRGGVQEDVQSQQLPSGTKIDSWSWGGAFVYPPVDFKRSLD
ncbi:hypothetical protein M422DRAFT_277298 [Sphaerobolus stellatus SS14]|uniref:Unplaced genomic scaffold SPHSTscaffold_1335, whole genome shotgun sequence n=1 Tax=Sphaerobolus stellatus (strain SS14) TaxID=990650 RepID=A0A0C9T0T3_SPHS4|nr:hypothetical protein M422DRAFT_277298 [Sphaerobolus stellatus SS14]